MHSKQGHSLIFVLGVLNHTGGLLACLSGRFLILLLHLFDECSKDAHLRMLIVLKVEVVLLSEAQL